MATAALPDDLAAYVDPAHLEPGGPDLHAWIRRVPGEPVVLRRFLDDELARGVARALRAMPEWQRLVTAHVGNRAVPIAEDEYLSHPHPGARHFKLEALEAALEPGTLPDAEQRAFATLLALITGGAVRRWLAAAFDLPLTERTSLEIGAYGNGDRISPHQDLVHSRVVAVNLYLDEEYAEGDGGELVLRDESGRESRVAPEFNSLSLIPIREGCWHRVEPFCPSRVGRQTVSLGYHLA